jgi:peptide/nickel transport system permease protein
MIKFILRRLLRGFIAIIVFQTLLFGLIHILPYDFTVFMVLAPETRRLARSQLGLDLPWWKQYFNWLGNFLQFDLGSSFMAWPTPVRDILIQRAPRTLLLFLSAAILAYLLGIWLGKLIAWKRGGWFEFTVTLGGVASYTSFAPFLGFLMINVFGWYLGWFPYDRLVNHNVWFNAPVSVEWILLRVLITTLVALVFLFGVRWMVKQTQHLFFKIMIWLASVSVLAIGIWGAWQAIGYEYLAWDLANHLVLPLGSVILLSFGETMLMMRTTMLEAMEEEYVLTAKAKGLPEHVIRDKHVARNAFLPVLTRLLINLPFVLTGSLAIELVFNWQAMGIVIFQAIDYQDIPLLMGILSVVGVFTLVGHIILDILYVYLDPRLREA